MLSTDDKAELVKSTGLTEKQVSGWFKQRRGYVRDAEETVKACGLTDFPSMTEKWGPQRKKNAGGKGKKKNEANKSKKDETDESE